MINVLIGGGIGKFAQISEFVKKNKLENIKLSVYDGIDNCKWNGGRVNRNCFHTQEQINFYRDNNIGFKLVFTNDIVDVNDITGNMLLEKFHHSDNGVILINDGLRDYIRNNFPLYKLTYSITGTDNINVPMKSHDVLIYRGLEKHYDLIVPRAEHNLDPKMLLLQRSKYEIYITEGCCTQCPVWSKHFKSISKANRDEKKFNNLVAKKYEDCWLERGSSQYDFDKHLLNHKQVVELYHKGFKYFKLSGRDADHREGVGTYNDYLEIILKINKYLK